MNVFAEITDRHQGASVLNFADAQTARVEDGLRHLLQKRCVTLAIRPSTFAMAHRIACNARAAGADKEQALQAGERYARRHILRSPGAVA